MAKSTRSSRFGLIGGNKAEKVNPLGLRRQYKAVCITHNEVLSPQWRNSEEEALDDRGTHRGVGHYIDFDVKSSG